MALLASLSLPLHLSSFSVRREVPILLYTQQQFWGLDVSVHLPAHSVQATLSKHRSKHLHSHFTTKEKATQDLLFLNLPWVCWITGFSISSSLFCILLAMLQSHGSSPEPGALFLCQIHFSLQSFNYHFRSIITQGREKAGGRRGVSRSVSSPIHFPLEAQKRNAVVL